MILSNSIAGGMLKSKTKYYKTVKISSWFTQHFWSWKAQNFSLQGLTPKIYGNIVHVHVYDVPVIRWKQCRLATSLGVEIVRYVRLSSVMSYFRANPDWQCVASPMVECQVRGKTRLAYLTTLAYLCVVDCWVYQFAIFDLFLDSVSWTFQTRALRYVHSVFSPVHCRWTFLVIVASRTVG